MSLKIVVLAKQVPDTRNVGKDAMKADGTINRAALPAIFNPEDLNALEQALRLKETHPGSTVTMLTMGPGRAAEIIREGLYRGADGGYLLTDRAFAGADTLATSYALATAIRKIGEYDIIIGGRQAIDGDTAQVGPQVAEKLGLAQVTYAEEILNVDEAGKNPGHHRQRQCCSLPPPQCQTGAKVQTRLGRTGKSSPDQGWRRPALRRAIRPAPLPEHRGMEHS